MDPSPTPSSGFWSGPGALLAGLLHGLLLILMFPPVGLWPLAFVAIIPLALAAAWGCGRPWRAGLLAAAGVLPAWLFEQRWMIDVTAVGYPLLAISQALMTGAFVTIVALACPRLGRLALPAVVIPVAWVGMECFRAKLFFTGYPWYLASHPLIEWPILAAPAAWIGALGVSFLVAMIAGAAVALLHPTAPSRRLGLGMLGTAAAIWGLAALLRTPPADPAAPTARIAVIQTNVPQSNKIGWSISQRLADWRRFEELTLAAAAQSPRPDLIVWPETMFPGETLNPDAVEAMRRAGLVWADQRLPFTYFADRLVELQRSIGIPMLIGAIAMDDFAVREAGGGSVEIDFSARYNSAFLVRDGAVQHDRYDKINLTPFGEVIPYLWRWPAIQNFVVGVGAAGMRFDLTHGTRRFIFEVPLSPDADGRPRPPLKLAAPICFEATMSEVCRALAYRNGRPAADLLINLSNDGWFNSATGGREQHFQAARWRTVELALPMVRAVNTGISASVDRSGRRLASGPDGADQDARVDGILTTDVPVGVAPGGSGTFYGRTGDIVGWGALAAMVLLLAGCVAVRRLSPASDGQTGGATHGSGGV